jgi:hypothetical protein
VSKRQGARRRRADATTPSRLALDGLTDRVQVLDGAGRVVLEELARAPGDGGCLRPCEPASPLGVPGEEPECAAVPVSRAVLNGRSRQV